MSLVTQLRTKLERSHELDLPISSSDVRGEEILARGAAVDAAVLIPVVDRPVPTVILTRRTDALPSHPGQVAFPGGKVDPGDENSIAAALREAEEEIALPRDRVELVGTTDLYLTGTGFHITPVIGVIPPDIRLVPEAGEVAAIFEVPFDHLFDVANYEEHELEWQGRMRRYFQMYWEEQRIWGVTAAIIMNLSHRLRAVEA
ncbi:CoA pyrophosphatase [Parasphingopyxis lamellibrachiae]|uniref:8-oxo-dGTP pyrophosphatase MutT (NUDIX family) n=1 Tax=Parasphingopyxis lamellibrachiae TaxID=680125 RepID=A0A3D9FER4_9SPHN|nr:CoA pyrophosphatase [Parasphingopyxis lamellibrachiae]RED16148.1 8-oxo-dGTP pyrophosphatase MutT (NUDIX family) [Parasphingopyxis lamellibrachiae]